MCFSNIPVLLLFLFSLCHPVLFCLSTLLYSAFLLPPFFPLYWIIFSICLGRLAPAFLCSVSHWQGLSWVIWQTLFTHPLHVEFPWAPTAIACKLHEQGRTTGGCLGTPWPHICHSWSLEFILQGERLFHLLGKLFLSLKGKKKQTQTTAKTKPQNPQPNEKPHNNKPNQRTPT